MFAFIISATVVSVILLTGILAYELGFSDGEQVRDYKRTATERAIDAALGEGEVVGLSIEAHSGHYPFRLQVRSRVYGFASFDDFTSWYYFATDDDTAHPTTEDALRLHGAEVVSHPSLG
jgi:hypothetical protein